MKKNKIKNYKTIITHSGIFHCDDILCICLLKIFNRQIKIKRVEETIHKNTSCTIVCDIGGGFFDHHGNKNEGQRCASKILFDTYKYQIMRVINNPELIKFINLVNQQDLTGNSCPELEGFKTLNAKFFENKEDCFKKAVLLMEQILLIFKNGGTCKTAITRIATATSMRTKIIKKESDIAYKYLKNKKGDTWELPCWLPFINLYFERDLDVPNKIIIKNERGYMVQSWNYYVLKGGEKDIQWKDTIVFCKTLKAARAVKVYYNGRY